MHTRMYMYMYNMYICMCIYIYMSMYMCLHAYVHTGQDDRGSAWGVYSRMGMAIPAGCPRYRCSPVRYNGTCAYALMHACVGTW